jgi:uncharacterized protein with GYD domain
MPRDRGDLVPHYKIEFAYSEQAWQALLKQPEDRTAAAEAFLKTAGGKLVALYYHSGEFDGTLIFESPDDSTANATAMAVLASGGIRTSRTTRLFTAKEAVESFSKAGKFTYRGPGQK